PLLVFVAVEPAERGAQIVKRLGGGLSLCRAIAWRRGVRLAGDKREQPCGGVGELGHFAGKHVPTVEGVRAVDAARLDDDVAAVPAHVDALANALCGARDAGRRTKEQVPPARLT